MRQGSRTDEPEALMISAKMAKALANPWRSRILMELATGPMSPSQFVDEVGGELTSISRCFRQLAEWGFIEITEERKGGRRRGGVEHVYRSIQRAHLDTPAWEKLSPFLRKDFSGNVVASYFKRVSEAIGAGTFDAEVDRHLSWDSPSLDRQAWTELTTGLDRFLDWIPQLEAEAAARMAESGEDPIPTTVGLAAFRSPKSSEVKAKAGRPVTDVGR
jgi:DNA-binding transcriptional ArsR family regulator